MAGASMNDIRARMKSVRSTMQITKAMELVATSKLRRAKEKAESSRPFSDVLHTAISELENSSELAESVWSGARDGNRALYVIIAGDRGLAGGYNSNIFKLSESKSAGSAAVFLPIGKKAIEYCRHRKKEIFSEACERVSEIGVGDCLAVGKQIAEAYAASQFDKVFIVYTKFASMISQIPVYDEILPFKKEDGETKSDFQPLFEGDIEEILQKIIPEYIGGVIWAAICEANASEHGARRSAMNSANKNAEEMIDALSLKYNRARQAVITQEITEIVSGAEAL